jgi:hypothetical protein
MGDVIATAVAWTIIAIASSALIGMAVGLVIHHIGGDDVPTPPPTDFYTADRDTLRNEVDAIIATAYADWDQWNHDRRSHHLTTGPRPMTEILEGHYSDETVRYQISAYDEAGNRVDIDWTDLFDLVLDKLGGSPCDVQDPDQ